MLKSFILTATIDLANGIFIECKVLTINFLATYVLAVDKFLDFDGFSHKNLDYIRSGYFILVSLSTIGYGDTYATVSFFIIIIFFRNGLADR